MRATGRFDLKRVESIVHEAMDRSAIERSAFLDTTCGKDADLRREVESLLQLEEDVESHFSSIASECMTPAAIADAIRDDPAIGERAGRYRLIERIGAGGMGNVYRAERVDEEFEQVVAIKLIRPGLDSEEILDRFRRERQVLADLNHPNIARLIDGGTTEAGRPYLVMEYVDGERINTFCDAERMTLQERVRLFCTVSDAVQFAHRNLIVHRDIKPGNILVARGAHAPTPKLLDFGIARVLAPQGSNEDRTIDAARMLTPAYASPEQLRGEPVSTSSDIYSLGVVLYELLVGRSPYAPGRHEPARLKSAVCEHTPLRPAAALVNGTDQKKSEVIARERSSDVPRLSRQLSGDLEQILFKALHKEPDRRYATVAALQDDLERWSSGRPVAARPDSAGYRLRKFMHRHQAGVATGIATAFALIAATVISIVLLMDARQARAMAEIENDTTAAINSFLTDMLASVDPREMGVDVTVRQVLDEAAARVDDELADYAAVEQGVQRTIGLAYRAIGLYGEALPHLDRALALSEQLNGPDHPETATALSEYGVLLRALGRYEEAEPVHRRALAIDQATSGENSVQAARSMNDLAQNLYDQGRFDEGRPLYLKAFEIRSAALGEQDPDLIASLSNLARASISSGDYGAAESQLRETLRLMRALHGEDHPDTVGAMNNVGFITMMQAKYDESERMYRDVVSRYRDLYGESHPDLARALNNLGECRRRQGKYSDAEQTHRQALTMRRETLGDDHPLTAVSVNNLALTLTHLERFDEALPLHEESLNIRRTKLGERHADVGTSLGNLGFVRYKLADYPAALEDSQEALNIRIEAYGDRHPAVAIAKVNVARVLVELDEIEEAEMLCREALAVQEERLPADHPNIHAARGVLGRVLLRAERFEEAEGTLLLAYASIEDRFGEDPSQGRSVAEDLVALYESIGRTEDVLSWIEQVERIREQTEDAG